LNWQTEGEKNIEKILAIMVKCIIRKEARANQGKPQSCVVASIHTKKKKEKTKIKISLIQERKKPLPNGEGKRRMG
jgi:hypothetical protein